MAEAPTRYVASADGVRLAWTEVGSGPTFVIAANHITDFKRDSPETLRYDAVQRLSQTFRVVRYDHRGTGSSQRNVERQGQEAWVEDLEVVVCAASPGQPVVLLAPSQASPYGSVFTARAPRHRVPPGDAGTLSVRRKGLPGFPRRARPARTPSSISCGWTGTPKIRRRAPWRSPAASSLNHGRRNSPSKRSAADGEQGRCDLRFFEAERAPGRPRSLEPNPHADPCDGDS